MSTIFEKLAQERQKALQREEARAYTALQKKVALHAMFRDALSVYTQHFCKTLTKIKDAGIRWAGTEITSFEAMYVHTLPQPLDSFVRCSARPPLSLGFSMGVGIEAEIGVYFLDYHSNGVVGDPNPVCLLYWTRTDVSENNIQRVMTVPPTKVRLETEGGFVGVRDQVDCALNLILTKGKYMFEQDIPERASEIPSET